MKRERQIEVYYVIFPKEANKVYASAFDFLDIVKSTIIMVFLIFTFVFRVVTVDGQSMMNTLKDKDKLLVTPITTTVKRGDIVVIVQPWNINSEIEGDSDGSKSIIKRVIGVAGDTIYIDFEKGEVYRNNVLLDEPYLMEYDKSNNCTFLPEGVQFPVTVPEGKVFVMGDNRNNSHDSRAKDIGMVDENYILGIAKYRVSPDRGRIGPEAEK